MKINILFITFIFVLIFLDIHFVSENLGLKQELKNYKKQEKQIKINRSYFEENISKKDYSETNFKLTDEGKKIIKNVKKLHKGPTLVSENYQEKDLCAGYIWLLSEKMWGNMVNYSIGMMNTKTRKCAQAREIPYFYEAFGGKILADFSKKFSLKKRDFIEKISLNQMQDFFSKAFSEQALFGDIGFLYKSTSYSKNLETWNYNSHITKNMGISDFEFVFSKFDSKKSNLDNFLENLSCSSDFKKYLKLFENYKFYLNEEEISFYKGDFYYIKKSILKQKINFKYLDKITYKDITLTHFFNKKSRVNSLLGMTCKGDFFLINILSINSRMIEKM